MDIKKIIRQVLNEEFGINNDVYKSANEVLELIKNDIENKYSNHKYKTIFDGDALLIKGLCSINLCDCRIPINYKSYIFNDDNTYEQYKRKYPNELMNANSQFSNRNDMIINVRYNKTLESGYDNSVRDRIQHEIDHLFKQIKSDRPLIKLGGIGEKVHNVLHNIDTDYIAKDPIIRRAAYTLYYCKKYEQDAYGNGLYNYLMNNEGTDIGQIIKESGLMKNINKLQTHIDYFKGINGTEEGIVSNEKLKKYYGLSITKLIKKSEIALERSINIMNRILFKYGKDTGTNVSQYFM